MHYLNQMNRSKLLGLSLVVLVAVILGGWFFLGSHKNGPPPPAMAALVEPRAINSGTIKFEAGAQQLALVRAQSIPVSPVPM